MARPTENADNVIADNVLVIFDFIVRKTSYQKSNFYFYRVASAKTVLLFIIFLTRRSHIAAVYYRKIESRFQYLLHNFRLGLHTLYIFRFAVSLQGRPCHCEAARVIARSKSDEAIPFNVRAEFSASPWGKLARLSSRD
jgi:hypothetical protein